jgi:hypothetical protein
VYETGGGGEWRSVRERLGEDKIGELVECRRSGMPLRDLAARYGISLSSVERVLGRSGLTRRRSRSDDLDLVDG